MNTPKTLAAVKKTQASKDWFGRPIVAAEIMANMEEDYEKELAELRSQLARSQAAGTIWYRRCFGEDPEWESAKDAIVGKQPRLIAQCKCPRAIREHGQDGCTEPDYIIHRGCPECGMPWSKFLPQNS